ncbi:MAG: Bcr/CflA family multidrug efflux transporter, partial [Serratia symbiotica]|nr:Bcr/CflA family multidrug efflux transporter [Serratia symbiotica]
EGKARRIFATIMPLVALSPALAPLMGAWLLNQTSWRMIFAVLLGFSILLLLPTLLLKKSTRPENAAGQSNSSVSFWQLFKSPVFSG